MVSTATESLYQAIWYARNGKSISMAILWVDCCGSKFFAIALGTYFYGKKVNILIYSEMAVSNANRRFPSFPKTEISVFSCLYFLK